jgi:hypothetical protein
MEIEDSAPALKLPLSDPGNTCACLIQTLTRLHLDNFDQLGAAACGRHSHHIPSVADATTCLSANIVLYAAMPILGSYVDPIRTDAPWLGSCIQIVFLCLHNQVHSFVVRISIDAMQEWKVVLDRYADFGTKLHCGTSLYTLNGANMCLNKVH